MPPVTSMKYDFCNERTNLITAATLVDRKEQILQRQKSNEDIFKDNQKQLSDVNNTSNEKTSNDEELTIIWKNVAFFTVLVAFIVYGIYSMAVFKAKWPTLIFSYIYILFAGFGVTAGSHRLWCHRSYKANIPLRFLLMIAHSAAFENDIFEWVRDHRVHHKYTETDADPHNAKRGFFFAHMGWLMCKKHSDVIRKGKTVDMSDVWADPIVRLQKRYFLPISLTFAFILPTFIPWYFWGENGWLSFVICILRYSYVLNGTWLVNSAAHFYGMKPYDKYIKPTENRLVSFIAFGEGWHNYHHAFPWDYKTAELGNYSLNFTTALVDFMAKIGWATQLKTASAEIIKNRVIRTGDLSIPHIKELSEINGKDSHQHHGGVWGWGDKDMSEDEAKEVRYFNNMRVS